MFRFLFSRIRLAIGSFFHVYNVQLTPWAALQWLYGLAQWHRSCSWNWRGVAETSTWNNWTILSLSFPTRGFPSVCTGFAHLHQPLAFCFWMSENYCIQLRTSINLATPGLAYWMEFTNGEWFLKRMKLFFTASYPFLMNCWFLPVNTLWTLNIPHLPESESRGSSLIDSALKSRGSASWSSSILSLSFLPFDLVYLEDTAAVNKKLNIENTENKL